jgi:hypothetical protein
MFWQSFSALWADTTIALVNVVAHLFILVSHFIYS